MWHISDFSFWQDKKIYTPISECVHFSISSGSMLICRCPALYFFGYSGNSSAFCTVPVQLSEKAGGHSVPIGNNRHVLIGSHCDQTGQLFH